MSALLFVFKVLGYILAIPLLLLLLVLLMPIRYWVSADIAEKTNGTIWVSWLILRACFDLEGNILELKILFFDLSKIFAGTADEQAASTETNDALPVNPKMKRPEKQEKPKTIKGKEKINKEEPKKEEPEKLGKEGILSKLKEMLSFAEKILEYPDKGKVIELTFTLLKRLLRALKPKQFMLDAVVGFDDPSLTGYILGAVGIIRGLTLWDMQVTGDFEQKVLRMTIQVKGGIIIGALLWPLLIYVLCMWKHIKVFLKWRKEHGQ